MKKLEKELKKYYENVGKIKVYSEGHKEMMRLIYPLLKLIEQEIKKQKSTSKVQKR